VADRSLNLGTIFTSDINQFLRGITRMRQAVDNMARRTRSFTQMNTAMRQLGTTAEQTGRRMRDLGKRVDDVGKQMRNTEGVWNRINRAMKVTASYGVAATVLFSITKALRAGASEIVTYDQALKNLQAITRATNAEVSGMGEVIKDVARTTKFSTGEVAEGMVLLGQAGFTATEAMQAMQATADLATGTLSDMKLTTDLLTTTVRAFGLQAIESTRVADVMANAINRSKLTIDKLRIAFNFVGAAASQAGLSLEQTAASMMVLANNGLRASTIGTGLRQVLARLLAPNRNLRQEFEAQGIQLDKVNPSVVGFRKAMENMSAILVDTEKKTVNMTKAYRLFGLRGAQAVAILARAFTSGEYTKMLDRVLEVGTAADMAATQAEGLWVKLKNLADRAKLIAVAFGEAGLINVMKAFLDVLKALTIAIEKLARSKLGQVIIQFTTFTIALTTTGKIIQLLGVGLFKLIGMFGAVSTVLVGMRAAFMGAGAGVKGLTAAFSSLGIAGATTLGPIIAIAAALAAVIVAIKLYASQTQRAVDATVKVQQKARTAADNLNLYKAALTTLAEKQRQGEDISNEHASTIQRLVAAYPQLSGVVSESTDALDKNTKAVQSAYREELQKNLEHNIELVGLYNKRIEEATWRVGLKAKVLGLLSFVLEKVGKLFAWLVDIVGKFAKQWILFATIVPRTLLRLVTGIDPVKKAFEDLNKSIDEAGKKSKELKSINEELENTFVEIANTMRELDPARPVSEILGELRRLGASEAIITRITSLWKQQEFQLKDVREAWRDTLDDLPSIFKDTFDQLNAVRQVDFAKALESMDKEIAAFKKKADEIGITTEKQYAAIARIRAKNLAEFVEDVEGETVAVEKRYDLELEMLGEFTEKLKERSDERIDIISKGYEEELHEAKKRGEGVVEIEKRMNEEIKAEREKLGEELRGIEEEQNRLRKEREETLIKEMVGVQKKLTKEIESELEKRIKDAEKTIEKTRKISEALGEKAVDAMTKIRSAGREGEVNEEAKYANDLRAIYALIDQARRKSFEESKGLYGEAIDKAAELPRVVQDEYGRTIQTLTSTQTQASNILTNIYSEIQNRAAATKKQQEETMQSAQSQINELNTATQEFAKTYDELSRKKLVLQTEEAMAKIQQTFGIVSELKTEWESIQSKTVTLNIKVKKSGSSESGKESAAEGADTEKKLGGKIIETPERFEIGGVVKSTADRLKNTMSFIARKTGGWVGKAMSIGQRIAGYGGGDKVRALLEPGEWVIRKEAVRRYGDRFMEMVNSMKMPTLQPQAVAVATNAVSTPVALSAPVKMQTGGPVERKSGGLNLNITIAPRFMTGDRKAARQVAIDVKRALEDLGVRLG